SHPSPSENLLDSIGTEHALALSILLNNINALSAISSCNLPRIGSWEERGKKRRRLPGSDGKENQDFALYGLANGAAAHCSSYGSAHSYGARGARQRSGGVEKYSSITSRQAPEHGSAASSPGPDPRISAAIFSAQLMQTPARSIPQPVQCQSEALAHHTSTLAAARRAVNLLTQEFRASGPRQWRGGLI